MTNDDKRKIAKAIAMQKTTEGERQSVYLNTLYWLGLGTNCCEEGLCGGNARTVAEIA